MEVKPGCKQTEVGVIPNDWRLPKLVELIDPARGVRYGIVQPGKYDARGRYMVRGQDYSDGWVEPSELFRVSSQVEEPFKNARIKKGDVLITIVGASTGRIIVTPDWLDGANLTQTTARLAFFPDSADSRYCAFVLSSWYGSRQVANYIKGGAQPGLNCGDIEKFLIPLPPTIAEQRAIAETLSDVDELLSGLDRLIAKKRDLKTAAMQQLLTSEIRLPGFRGDWPVKTFAELFSFSGGYSASRDELSTEGHCYLHYGDIHTSSKTFIDVEADYQDIPKLDVPLHRVSSGSLLEDGDVVFVDASEDDEGTSKHVVVVNEEGAPFISGLHTIVAKSKTDELANAYRRYCFQTSAIRQQFLFYSVGTKVSGISKTNIAKLKMPVPSVPEQTAIAEVLWGMDAELAALEQRREKTRALKQAMMQELLTGRIRLLVNSSNATVLPFVESVSPARPKPQERTHSWAFNEAVVIAVLAAEFGTTQFPLGRMRYTKLAYLLHRHAEHVAEGYLKKAAGPYNPATRYAGPEKIACESGYIKRHKRDQFEGLIASEKNAQARAYFLEWYGQAALDWLQQFRFWKKEELERVATVDMAMEELRRANREATVDSVKEIIVSSPDWLPKLERAVFADAHLDTAIKLCRSLFPLC